MELDIFNPQVSTVAKGLEGKVILVYGGNNVGKAQPIDTLIPTPNGAKKLGDLKVGDYVYDRKSNPTKILEIYDQGKLDNYKVGLADGRVTYCNNEHLWTYFDVESENGLTTKTLQEMIDEGIIDEDGYCRFRIPLNSCADGDGVSIAYIQKMDEQVEMRCIYVDNEEHLYLTNDFIVTHNTKQATRMKKPFYLPFENGLNAISGVPFCPINKWSDFIKVNKQLTDPATVKKAREMYSTIIFDEVEAAANYCQEFICQKYKAPSIGEGNGGYGLWKEYATEFWKQINKLVGAGYCCYFIAHAQEKEGFITPKADKRALDPIINNTDLTVYVRSNGVDEEGKVVKSSAYLAETDEFFARSRFDYLPTTYIEEFTAENLEEVIIKAIEIQEKEEGIKAVTFEEQKAQRTTDVKSYDDLMDTLQSLGEKMADNGYLEDLQTIVANQLGEGKKASDLKKGQEQLIEAIIYDIESFIEENGI